MGLFRRDRLVFTLIVAVFAAILGRAYYIQVDQAEFLQGEGDKRQIRTIDIPAPRGVVYDRHDSVLALSTPMKSISVDAKMIVGYQQDYAKLLKLLNLDEALLKQRIKKHKHRSLSYITQVNDERLVEQLAELSLPGLYLKSIEMVLPLKDGTQVQIHKSNLSIWVDGDAFSGFQQVYAKMARILSLSQSRVAKKIINNPKRRYMYLKRAVEPVVGKQIEALNLYGVYVDDEYKRYYPAGEITAHLVGFTNIDDQGQEGLELSYNNWLDGEPGRKQVIKDRAGRIIDFVKDVTPAQPGQDIHLSIDKNIQYYAYRALKKVMIEHDARSASAVVLDAKTGEVLAMVSLPGYNPNDRSQVTGSAIKNRVITDLMEPGSTVKPFIVAKALHEKVIQTDELINTSPGSMRVQGYRITDGKNHGKLTPGDIIQKSSNVGASKVALKMQPEQQFELWQQLGFGTDSGLYLQGEASRPLKPVSRWQDLDQTSSSYGYGFNVNLLTLARAYLIFANEGQMMPLSLFKHTGTPIEKVSIVSPDAANQTLEMMERVVAKGGTAPKAQIPGYRVAGKTGTTHKTKRGGYEQNQYVSQFAGIVPVSDPDMVMVVRVNEPSRGVYFGGAVAAPVFKDVMQQALRLRNIPHDMPLAEQLGYAKP